MADQRKITLRQGHATPKNIVLRELPVATPHPGTKIYLYVGHANPKNIILRDPTTLVIVGGPFPVQFAGLRTFYGGAVRELCLVAVADAPAGMGGVLKVHKGGTDYAVYLVDTADPNASPVRINTSTAVKAIRLKT